MYVKPFASGKACLIICLDMSANSNHSTSIFSPHFLFRYKKGLIIVTDFLPLGLAVVFLQVPLFSIVFGLLLITTSKNFSLSSPGNYKSSTAYAV